MLFFLFYQTIVLILFWIVDFLARLRIPKFFSNKSLYSLNTEFYTVTGKNTATKFSRSLLWTIPLINLICLIIKINSVKGLNQQKKIVHEDFILFYYFQVHCIRLFIKALRVSPGALSLVIYYSFCAIYNRLQ